ncbi:MAG: hypothetical protein ABSH39_05780 [Candidatus Acidiferrum sp.]|jgi:hypothetical protein
MAQDLDPKKNIPYHFHAYGHAFSAHFNRPADVPIPAQAATALPSTGGFAHSRVDSFVESRLVSFKLGETHVSGSWEQPTIVTTSVTAVLAGLNLLDFLTVEKIVCRLTGRYVSDKKNRESHIIALGSHFDDFRLGGYEIKVILRHDLLVNSNNFAELADNLKRSKKPHTTVVDGAAHCSLVEKIEIPPALKDAGVKVEGHIIEVPHFGELSLAEIFATPGNITLTMLKFKLGSPDGGGGSGGQGGTNGQPVPPLH